MPNSLETIEPIEPIEQKVSNEILPLPTPLAYTRPDQFTGNLLRIEGGIELESQLWRACYESDLKTLKEILETNNIGVNVRLQQGHTLLMCAAQNNKPRTLNFLLEQQGIDVFVVGPYEETALSLALEAWDSFRNANYGMAYQLIGVGMAIDEAQTTLALDCLLQQAWHCGNQEAANQVVILGANPDALLQEGVGFIRDLQQKSTLTKQHFSEYLDNAKLSGNDVGHFSGRVSGHVEEKAEEGCLQLQLLSEDICSRIASFLFRARDLAVGAFNLECVKVRQRLSEQFPTPAPTPAPIPRSLFFMGNFENLMGNFEILPKPIVDEIARQQKENTSKDARAWKLWNETYYDKFPSRKDDPNSRYGQGRGPGAMVVYKPIP